MGPAGSHIAPEGNWSGRILVSHVHKYIAGGGARGPRTLGEKGTKRGKEVVTPSHQGPRMCDLLQSLFLSVVWGAQPPALLHKLAWRADLAVAPRSTLSLDRAVSKCEPWQSSEPGRRGTPTPHPLPLTTVHPPRLFLQEIRLFPGHSGLLLIGQNQQRRNLPPNPHPGHVLIRDSPG